MSGFAARLSASQRAALAALGYHVLERASAPIDSKTAPIGGLPADKLPVDIIIDGLGADTPLEHGVLRALAACGAPTRRDGERLHIALGGADSPWQLHLAQLRDAPQRKAALWRVLCAWRARSAVE
jgi:hypothetical protein